MKALRAQPWVKGAIIHPFVFAVFPALSLYAHNLGKGYLGEAVGTTIVAFLLSGLFWLLVNLVIKEKGRSAIITSMFFLLFFSYGHAINAFTTVIEKMQLTDKAGFLIEGSSSFVIWLAFWVVLFAAISYYVVRFRGDLSTATKFLNVIALALLVMVGANFVVGGVRTFLMPHIRIDLDEVLAPRSPGEAQLVPHDSVMSQPVVVSGDSGVDSSANNGADSGVDNSADSVDQARASEFINSWQEGIAAGSVSAASGTLPDIYYIILDMYARADFLREVYHVDNSEFLSYLAERGFYVAAKSRSNYPYTILSLPSSLNLMYLDQVAKQVGEESTNLYPAVVMLKNNRVFQYLGSLGYNIVAFSSGYGISEIQDADVYMAPSGWRPTEFQNILADSTPLVLLRKTQDQVRRELVLYTFDHLADAAQNDSPDLVFAHIPAPHYPFVFGPNGEHVASKPEFDYEYDEFIEVYGNQLLFVNKQMQNVIEEILTKSTTPPIIVLQADHGPYSAAYSGDADGWPEKFAILNAYYFPDQNYEALSEDITPVNTFRVIFNNYFDMDYELLENRSYSSSYSKSPYLFTDMTDQVSD